jgi:DNA-binding winged helix-turn-helix (wHTH) protein/tetratricopeptide (TPR) repeat protein
VADAPVLYHFDEFCLDTVKGVLIHGGASVLDLRPKSFALLHLLVQRPESLHGREELLQALWPDVVVTDDSLTQCVSDLRRAFGDRAPQVLKTVPRRGYVLTTAVRVEMVAEPARRADTIRPGVDRTTTAARLVLQPFGSLHAGVDDELARTLTSDLMTELTKFEGVRVLAARSSVPGSYRMNGELRFAKQTLRIDARLEDAESGDTVWAEVFEKPAAEPSDVDGLVQLLAATIVRQLDREDLRRARQKQSDDLTARELYLIGRDHHQRGTADDTLVALSMFDQAMSLAPEFPLPYAWQAYTVHRVITHGWGPPIDEQTAREQALSYARRAVQLEPESALCLSRLAFVLILHQRWDEAVDTARAAVRMARPSDYASRNTCCEVLAHAGFAQEAAGVVRRALALDPHCPPTTRSLLGRALLLTGDPEAALPELRWCAARLPDYVPCFQSIIVAAIETGRSDEAARACKEAARLQPHWLPKNQTGTWFFRYDRDAERFLSAFRAAGWVDPAPPLDGQAAKSAEIRPRTEFTALSRRQTPDLRATKPLGNA